MRNRKPMAKNLEPVRNASPAMRVAFPGVNELRVELQFDSADKWAPATQVHILHPPAAASFRYPCPISGCSGHFELDSSINDLLKRSESKLADDALCAGVRPEDRSTSKACALHLRYRVEATYGTVSRR